jgi:hypothetical protein
MAMAPRKQGQVTPDRSVQSFRQLGQETYAQDQSNLFPPHSLSQSTGPGQVFILVL